MSAPLLAVRGVKSFYGPIMALKGVDVDVNEAEIVALIGANGAGKSTLMMTICGDPRAREGAILFEGRDITRLPTHEIARLRIAQSPEGRRIFPRMTVRENLMMGAGIDDGAHFDEDLARIKVLFPVLAERLDQRGGTLSGGEQQMLAIGRALMSRPRLLLLDEPSLGLAPLVVKQIFEVIRELNRDGVTIFLVEQNAYHALKIAHRAYVMVSGNITMSGTGRELLAKPEVRAAILKVGATDGRSVADGPALRPWRERSLGISTGDLSSRRRGGLRLGQGHGPDLAPVLAGAALHAGHRGGRSFHSPRAVWRDPPVAQELRGRFYGRKPCRGRRLPTGAGRPDCTPVRLAVRAGRPVRLAAEGPGSDPAGLTPCRARRDW
jgi:branched-chain amino acid transport system ATP-binding protein